MQVDLGPSRPHGYDENGVSLYYREERYGHALDGKLNFPGSSGIARQLKLGTAADLKPTRRFMETGLQHYIRTNLKGSQKPFYVFDDHNHALYGLREAVHELWVAPGAVFINIDEHADALHRQTSRNPEVEDIRVDRSSPMLSLEEIARLAHACDIHKFIAPALDMGLIGEVWWVDPKFQGREFSIGFFNRKHQTWQIPFTRMGINQLQDVLTKQGNSPLSTFTSLDYDYFNSIKAGSPRERRDLRIINQVMRRSGAVATATSPGFIDQERAISLAKRLLRYKSTVFNNGLKF